MLDAVKRSQEAAGGGPRDERNCPFEGLEIAADGTEDHLFDERPVGLAVK